MKTLILGILLVVALAACGHEQSPTEQAPHCRNFYDNGQC